MNEELEKKLIEKLNSMDELFRLKEIEKEMEVNEEVLLLVKSFKEEEENYNYALKHFGEKNEITKNAYSKLYKAKCALDSHPLIEEYYRLFALVNEPLHYLENHLINLFKGGGFGKC